MLSGTGAQRADPQSGLLGDPLLVWPLLTVLALRLWGTGGTRAHAAPALEGQGTPAPTCICRRAPELSDAITAW